MKKVLTTMALCSFAFGLGLGLNNVAFSDGAAPVKIAYVNVGKVLAASKTIKSAEDARVKETKDMLKWYDSIQAEIHKQTTQQAKDALIKKHEPQLTAKKKAIKASYAKKITQADSQIDAVITQKAKELGYNIVLKKDAVLFGGTDITSHVLPLVK